MTKKDLFIILIKILALYALTTSFFSILPMLTSTLRMELSFYDILYTLAYLLFFCFLFFLFTIQSEKIVALLKLDKGFDSDFIQLGNLDKTQIIQLGLIIVGGLTFLSNLPDLIVGVLYLFKSNVQTNEYDLPELRTTQDNLHLLMDFIRVLLGYLILTNHDRLAKKLL